MIFESKFVILLKVKITLLWSLCLCSTQKHMHALEFFSPHDYFGLDWFPFSFFNLAQFMWLDYYLFVHLVYFCVNNFVSNRLNSPFFDLALWNVQVWSQIFETKVRWLFSAETANLHVALFLNRFFHSDPLLLHQRCKRRQLLLELFGICLGEQAQQVKNIVLYKVK